MRHAWLFLGLVGCATTSSTLVPPGGSLPVAPGQDATLDPNTTFPPPVASGTYKTGRTLTEMGSFMLASGVVTAIIDAAVTPCSLGVTCSTQAAVDSANTNTLVIGVISGVGIGAGLGLLIAGIPMMITGKKPPAATSLLRGVLVRF